MTRLKRIRRIKFGLLSPQEVRKMSATKIITADTYDSDGFPIEMGLMDPRNRSWIAVQNMWWSSWRVSRSLRPYRACCSSDPYRICEVN